MTRSLALAFALASASPPAGGATARGETAGAAEGRAALLAADDALARDVARDGWAAGLGARLADDAVVLLPGEDLARGRAEVEALLRRAPGAAARPALRRLVGAASADAALGFTAGALDETGGDGTAKPGRYAAVWRRSGGGTLRVAALVRTVARGAHEEPPRSSPVVAGHAGAARPGDPVALRAQVLDADRAFAARAAALAPARGFGPAFPEWADPDAILVRADGIAWGREAVAKAYAGSEPGEALTWEPVDGGAAASGDLGWTTGTAVYRGPGERATVAYTKYLTIWARQPDGSWRWLLDAGNLRPAPAR